MMDALLLGKALEVAAENIEWYGTHRPAARLVLDAMERQAARDNQSLRISFMELPPLFGRPVQLVRRNA